AVDDARVIQRVADHGVLLAEQRLEQTTVRVEARAVEDRVLRAEEPRDPILELFVDVLRAADEADRGHAVAPAIERGMRGGEDLRIVGQAQVVVRAEVDDLEIRSDRDLRALRRADDAFRLVETALADRGDLLADRVEEALIHGRQHHGTAALVEVEHLLDRVDELDRSERFEQVIRRADGTALGDISGLVVRAQQDDRYATRVRVAL